MEQGLRYFLKWIIDTVNLQKIQNESRKIWHNLDACVDYEFSEKYPKIP